ncbi:MAG: hypothetical protein FD122_3337 [Stygiobacter sp.]|nr:MAG: hypothetical protein FD122_3337 [Stygiobacter sp.]KAF0214782.1 MAG: hypothetical protein FD178_2155 [Ignavibacteria bacterium]
MTTKIKSSNFTFQQYLVKLGYQNHAKWILLFQMFRKSLTQHSFLLFWRMWNPFLGYFLFITYVRLGGNRNRSTSLFAVFILSGFFLHDLLIYLLTGVFSFVFTIGFQFYSALLYFDSIYNFERKIYNHSSIRNVSLNLFFIIIGLLTGYSLNYFLFPNSIIYKYFS